MMERGPLVCPNPVFVIGAPRSGTSIVPWSLAHSGELTTSNESDLLWELFGEGKARLAYEAALRKKSWVTETGIGRAEFLQHLGVGINALYTSRSAPRRWIDATPANTMMVDVLAEMFPGAQFLHMLRDGRRVVHSMVHFADRFAPDVDRSTLPRWARSFPEACSFWVDFVNRSLDFAELEPTRCLTVALEDLTGDPEGGFQRMQDFLGVPRRDTSAAFFQTSRINSSFFAESWKKGQPEGVDHPGLTRPWTTWTDDERSVFMEIAGATMVRARYLSDVGAESSDSVAVRLPASRPAGCDARPAT